MSHPQGLFWLGSPVESLEVIEYGAYKFVATFVDGLCSLCVSGMCAGQTVAEQLLVKFLFDETTFMDIPGDGHVRSCVCRASYILVSPHGTCEVLRV